MLDFRGQLSRLTGQLGEDPAAVSFTMDRDGNTIVSVICYFEDPDTGLSSMETAFREIPSGTPGAEWPSLMRQRIDECVSELLSVREVFEQPYFKVIDGGK